MQSSERQKEIVAAVFNLISDHGIQELTIKKIAQSVGVSEPAIYRHFQSKSDILAAVVDEMIAHRNTTFARVSGNSASTTLASFFTVQAMLFEDMPALTIMLFPEDLFRNDSVLLARILGMMKETLDRIHALLQAGIDEGAFRPDMDRNAVALMLMGGFRLLMSSWRLDPTVGRLKEKTRRFVDGVWPLISR
ncbi:MAG: TetR/AcrR family transcriptional regulator [Spirochaetia bacterium]|jgi:AcrR family transcriptional regulator|nr:TetR/AcrR family transcriptional regulator [Spirochaetia bacterium]